MLKVYNGTSTKIMTEVFPLKYNLANQPDLSKRPVKIVYSGIELLVYLGPKNWNQSLIF